MICSRCGTSRRPIGPHRRMDVWGRECLRYACDECGYSWNEPISGNAPPVRSTASDGIASDFQTTARDRVLVRIREQL